MGKEWGKLPRGVTVREHGSGQSIQVAFTYNGIRCREIIPLPVTKRNINYASNTLGEIKGAIERETFKYSDYFPNSSKLKLFGQAVKSNKTVEEYLTDYQMSAIKRGLSPSTLEGYRKVKMSLAELHQLPVRHLTAARLKQFIKESKNSPKTLRNKFSYLRSALAEAVTDGIVEINPADSVTLSNYTEKNNKVDVHGENKDIKPFTPDEIARIYQHCKHDEINIVKVCFNTGLRSSEWSSLKWADVDFAGEVINVRTAIVHGIEKGTKSKSGRRSIPLCGEALTALRDQMPASYLAGEYVFAKYTKTRVKVPNGELNRINPDSFRKHRWTRILNDAGVDYRYPYQMRHTFATKHISNGVNIWQLANWMGHSSPEMLFNHYGNFIEAHEKINLKNDTLMTHRKTLK
jgi:integrase